MAALAGVDFQAARVQAKKNALTRRIRRMFAQNGCSTLPGWIILG
jgi:hypothetical protein